MILRIFYIKTNKMCKLFIMNNKIEDFETIILIDKIGLIYKD